MVQPFFVYGGQGKSEVGLSYKIRVSGDSVLGVLRLFFNTAIFDKGKVS